jgi:hypothetical protein
MVTANVTVCGPLAVVMEPSATRTCAGVVAV